LRQLERQRIVTLVGLIDEGQQPPVPRPPLGSCDPVWIAERSEVPRDILIRIQHDSAVARSPA
jgi:hypothetical protein